MYNEFLMNDKPQDECGVFGIYSKKSSELSRILYYGLYALQHRGQESSGMAVTHGNDISYYKDNGLVNEVFNESVMSILPEGDIALGHVRSSSNSITNPVNAQPIVYNGKLGKFALAINGKITNSALLRNELIAEGIVFQSSTDCEVIANLINKYCVDENNINQAIITAVKQLEGSFALGIMTSSALIAVRDEFGLRPMVLGENADGDYFISSESCGLDATGAELIRDVKPGELLIINSKGLTSEYFGTVVRRPCIFEYVYTARADSIIDERSVYEARYECGRRLARKLKLKADIVAGVPDSAVVAARGYAAESQIPYIDVLEKNRYVGRTFIQPNQYMRENSVKIKLNAHRANIQNKSIILIDDSIVRGTTSKKIVDLLKKSGAKEVHMVIASPIVKHPCYTGIDIETYEQLIGASKSAEEIGRIIGADSLHFMDVKDLLESCSAGENNTFCSACFDGNYPDDIENKLRKRKEIL